MKPRPYCNPDNGNKRATIALILIIFGLFILCAIIGPIAGCKTNAEVDAKAGLINDFREMLKEVKIGDTAGGDISKPTVSPSNTQVQGVTELQLYIIIAAILFGVPLAMYVMNKLQVRELGRNGTIDRRK